MLERREQRACRYAELGEESVRLDEELAPGAPARVWDSIVGERETAEDSDRRRRAALGRAAQSRVFLEATVEHHRRHSATTRGR